MKSIEFNKGLINSDITHNGSINNKIEVQSIGTNGNVRTSKCFMPKKITKKLIVFDMDETLIHSVACIKNDPGAIEIMISTGKSYLKINKRPFMYEFLDEMKKMYDLAIYTASQGSYAKCILKNIDPDDKYFE